MKDLMVEKAFIQSLRALLAADMDHKIKFISAKRSPSWEVALLLLESGDSMGLLYCEWGKSNDSYAFSFEKCVKIYNKNYSAF